MRGIRIPAFLACAAMLLVPSCSDGGGAPTALEGESIRISPQANVALETTPFTFRAPLAPYKIQQLPDFMVHSKVTSDIVLQRSIFTPGAGGWHTHPGPSYVYVLQGQIRLEQFSEQGGCRQTPVFQQGDAYFEVGNEVHRAVVVSSEDAVLLVVRFNIPVGGAIATSVPDPGC